LRPNWIDSASQLIPPPVDGWHPIAIPYLDNQFVSQAMAPKLQLLLYASNLFALLLQAFAALPPHLHLDQVPAML
jgi:hypothetical protein